MNRRSVLPEIATALVLSLLGGATHAILTTLGAAYPLRASVLVVLTLYSLILISRSSGRSGRFTAGALSLLIPAVLVAADASTVAAVCVQAATIWMLRCALRHRSLVAVAADLALTLLAVLSAGAAFIYTGSPTAAIWCLLLGQAFHVFIPTQGDLFAATVRAPQDDFEKAHRRAENALRQLFNH